jgi:hypothetical protein
MLLDNYEIRPRWNPSRSRQRRRRGTKVRVRNGPEATATPAAGGSATVLTQRVYGRRSLAGGVTWNW